MSGQRADAGETADRPRIAVCVVTFHSAELIADLVASLGAGCAGLDWGLVFADNASGDDTVARIAAYAPDARLVRLAENRGYAAGVNAAIGAAGPRDAYLVLNADVRLGPGCAQRLYRALEPGVGVVVPRLLDAHGQLIWSMRREPTVARAWADALVGAERIGARSTLGEIVADPRLYESARDTDWAEGSTQLIGAACAQACAPWDESFFLYSEETEYELRARDEGFVTRYEPSAVATHLEGGSAGSPRLWSLLTANRVRLFATRHRPPAAFAFWAATVVREATRALLGKPTSAAALRDLVRPSRLRAPRGPDWLAEVDASPAFVVRLRDLLGRGIRSIPGAREGRRIGRPDREERPAHPHEQEEHAG